MLLGINSPHFLIRLTRDVNEDLKVWQQFLAGFNGRFFSLSVDWTNSHHLKLYTNASGALALGRFLASIGVTVNGPRAGVIATFFLEFYPIVLSLYLWGYLIKDQRVLFFTDNEALVHVIKRQSCREKDLMFFARKLALVCLKYNTYLRSKHVPGLQNKLADCLSRLQLQTFRQLAPAYMHKEPTVIPPHLQPLNWVP